VPVTGRTVSSADDPAARSPVTIGAHLSDKRLPPSVTGGTYTLLIEVRAATAVTFGAAGERSLSAGPYAYVGSAAGGGGFARVQRHRELADGDRDTHHWHVDYLLGAPETTLVGDRRLPGRDAECAVAAALREHADPIPGLGASDCDCGTHLFSLDDDGPRWAAVERVHDRV
jgi:endonuclease-3